MRKYTIIYGEFFNYGSHRTSVIKFEHIECEPEHLKEEVENLIGWSSVWFIFDGHCEQTKD